MALVFHNAALQALCVEGGYRVEQVQSIAVALQEHGVLDVTPLATGLYPASGAPDLGVSGYGRVWVRDNVYVALALLESGRPTAAAAAATALMAFYRKHRHRLAQSPSGDAPRPLADRPHVRFDGESLEEISGEVWPHAQNDALGYCLWLCARLARRHVIQLDRGEFDTLALLANYLWNLRYWDDEDSGHWEETRKRSASSIGVVVAGMQEWAALVGERPEDQVAGQSRTALLEIAESAIQAGVEALTDILPSECTQASPLKNRRYDAALLCLLYPLDVARGPMADRILSEVRQHLQGEIGIRRYPGDSYWAPDYDSRLPEADRTRDYSEDIESRNRLLQTAGDEAQWCIFDPLLSAFHGRRFLATGAQPDLAAQALHFNRSIAQITADWRCPELYYKKRGAFVANPHVPLLWTQANLQLALLAMQSTAGGRR
jgi:phosphorylase kinase alpha/beta subunit